MSATMWSQPNCKYCDLATSLLLKHKYVITKKIIGHGYTKEDLLKSVPTARSVPQIFINDIYVGGYKEVCEMLEHD